MIDNLTFGDLLKIKEVIDPPLYYAISDLCQVDKIILVQKGRFHPEFILFHPEDMSKVKDILSGRRLVKIEEYKDGITQSDYKDFAKCLLVDVIEEAREDFVRQIFEQKGDKHEQAGSN